jgi:5-methylcytosine-specific restriction endonuclease McrA
VLELTCATCDVPFQGRNKQSRFCSPRCRWTEKNRKRRPDLGPRSCPGCGADLTARHGKVKYCSNACRRWVASGNPEPRELADLCAECSTRILAPRVGKVYCSRKCKLRASEKRRNRNDTARYQRERERRITYALAYAKRHPEVGQAAKNRRKALKREAGIFRVSGEDWRRLCARFQNECAYCRERRPLTMDHVIPLTKGGRHSIGNLLPACAPCNSSKSDRFLAVWKARVRRG